MYSAPSAPGVLRLDVFDVGQAEALLLSLDDDTLARARIYVESREAATRESGDVIAAGRIFAEIGEVVAGTKAGRASEDEITLFKSVGTALEDLAAAELVAAQA